MANMLQIFYKIRDECKKKVNESLSERNLEQKYCEIIWDGIMCWPKTEAGVELKLPCPEYFGFSPKNMVTKKCTDQGHWFINENLNKTWTNYSQCSYLLNSDTGTIPFNSSNLMFLHTWLPKIKTMTHVGYGISLIILIFAIIIFLSFKKLQCARNRLHMHLFISFSFKALVTLLKDFLFVDGIVLATDIVLDGSNKYVKEHNFWLCKVIISLWQYFILTNHFLILMEGIYLHNLLFSSLNTDKNNIKLYILFGWGLPYFFVIPWVTTKLLYEDHYCWTNKEESNFILFIQIPIIISILINFILFSKIVHILSAKLNMMYIQHRSVKYRRLIRSTLILMPLFGVPYIISILTWYNAIINEKIEIIWIFIDQLYTSLHGSVVAFLYCILNKEVRMELKKKIAFKGNNDKNKRNSFPLYATISNRFSFTVDNNE